MVAIAEIPVDTQHYIMQHSTDSCKFHKKLESYEVVFLKEVTINFSGTVVEL